MVERANQYLETSFLPGRTFTAPEDFNTQLTDWLTRANTRTVRSLRARPGVAEKPAGRERAFGLECEDSHDCGLTGHPGPAWMGLSPRID